MTQIVLDDPETSSAADSSRPPTRTRTRSRYGWPLGREITLILGGLLLYRMVRLVVRDEIDQAFANSHTVVAWERSIGIFNEVRLQSTVLGSDAVVWLLNRYYFFGHFGGAAIFLTWLFVRHYSHYGRVRRVLYGTTFTALGIHIAFPLAPPRWFPDLGFVDTLQTYGPKVYDSEAIASTVNQIAAMPSLHVGWALIAAWGIVKASGSPWRWVSIAHPIFMTSAVVITANHWWLDAVVAGAVVMVIIALDSPIQGRLEQRQLKRDQALVVPG